METVWMTLMPIHGEYCHIKNLCQIGEIYQVLLDRERTHNVEAISVCKSEMRKWTLTNPARVLVFHHYLLNRFGKEEDLKIRVIVSEKTARTRMLT